MAHLRRAFSDSVLITRPSDTSLYLAAPVARVGRASGSKREICTPFAIRSHITLPPTIQAVARVDLVTVEGLIIRPSVQASTLPATVSEQAICPPFTLSSTMPGNEIIKQRSFQSRYCIPSEVADQLIDDPAVLLARLNDILGTDYSIQSEPGFEWLMRYCIDRKYDLGMSYGMLRPFFAVYGSPTSELNPLMIVSGFASRECEDRARRKGAVVDGLVVDSTMPPRRIWDLYSNRVLPIWVLEAWTVKRDLLAQLERISAVPVPEPLEYFKSSVQAVSHAWMSPEQRINVHTPINSHKWPVPSPQDISLDDLRLELLNNNNGTVGYAWLDVLCLRQKGGEPDEDVRRTWEWEIDVPTIGTIYSQCAFTVIYLNGLGRPFQESDLENDRHWCNRAWTMQELDRSKHVLLGGVTAQSPAPDISGLDRTQVGFAGDLSRRIFRKRSSRLFGYVSAMSRRRAEGEVDKVAGLAYAVYNIAQPAFYAAQGVESAWSALVDCMSPVNRADLFFFFPAMGDGESEWMPSWSQLIGGIEGLVANTPFPHFEKWLDEKSCPTLPTEPVGEPTRWDKDGKAQRESRIQALRRAQRPCPYEEGHYSCWTICFPSCRLNGFDNPTFTMADSAGRGVRRGTVKFCTAPEDVDSTVSLGLTAYHSIPITSDQTYCLLSAMGDWYLYDSTCCYWVVGYLDREGCFHKISVLQIDNEATESNLIWMMVLDLLPLKNVEDAARWENRWVRKVRLA